VVGIDRRAKVFQRVLSQTICEYYFSLILRDPLPVSRSGPACDHAHTYAHEGGRVLRFSAHVCGSSQMVGYRKDRRERPILTPWMHFLLLFRHATRSSSKSQSAYMVSLFLHSLRRSNANLGSNRTIGDDKRKLLGQHIWKDILLKPSEGEKRHRSGIFFCVYNSIRDVQKEGTCERPCGVSTRRSDLSFIRLEANRL